MTIKVFCFARRLRKEALACYEQADIDCANRDEVAARHTAEDGGMLYAMAEVPGFERTAGSTWQSVARNTGNLETHWLNGEIVRLGEALGVPTPANAVCMQLADRLVASGSGPGLFTTADFYAELAALS